VQQFLGCLLIVVLRTHQRPEQLREARRLALLELAGHQHDVRALLRLVRAGCHRMRSLMQKDGSAAAAAAAASDKRLLLLLVLLPKCVSVLLEPPARLPSLLIRATGSHHYLRYHHLLCLIDLK
jgi:hypothetical protein